MLCPELLVPSSRNRKKKINANLNDILIDFNESNRAQNYPDWRAQLLML